MRWKILNAVVIVSLGAAVVSAQNAAQRAQPRAGATLLTWEQVKDRFEMNNATLLAGKLNIDELKAQEVTAHLRPNPDFTLSADGTQIAPSRGIWTPFAGTFVSPGITYLFERRNKRGLRFEAAKRAPRSARPSSRIQSATCSLTCGRPLWECCRQRRCCNSRKSTSSTTTKC
jgi:cobalt-zinc-cadmium efflux system outer membrane protein